MRFAASQGLLFCLGGRLRTWDAIWRAVKWFVGRPVVLDEAKNKPDLDPAYLNGYVSWFYFASILAELLMALLALRRAEVVCWV